MNEESVNKVIDLWKSKNITNEPIKKQLQLEIVNQIASAFTVGKYYYMIFNFNTLDLKYVDPGVKSILGINPEDFNLEKFFSVVHPNDLEKLHTKESVVGDFLYSNILPEDISLYKVVYMLRLRNVDGEYKTILHQSRAINVSDDGKIQQVLTVHSDVTFLDIPFNHKISFISQEKPCYFATEKDGVYSFEENTGKSIFSIREIEVIKNISEGKTYNEIAELLFVSPNTINFHKKNILRKSECNNSAQLIAKCIREGII